jgi:hypothetical protein
MRTGSQRDAMAQDCLGGTDLIASGTTCPMPDCGALAVTYRSTGFVKSDDAEMWEFICGRCGIEFTAPKSDLIFESVPRYWLFATIHFA